MPTIATKYFGSLEYEEGSVIRFPFGLPGFEDQDFFVLIEGTATAPVVFLQSLARADLRFPTLPMTLLDPDYRLDITDEDIQALGLARDNQPPIRPGVLCLAVIAAAQTGPPTANLLAPIVVNLNTRRAVQAIRIDSAYSHVHSLGPEPACW